MGGKVALAASRRGVNIKWVPAVKVAIIASVLVVVVARPAFAPQPVKPEKLTIDTVTWNSQARSFEISYSLVFGAAVAGDAAGFGLGTSAVVVGVTTVGPVDSAVVFMDPDERGVRRADGVVLLYSSLPGGGADGSATDPVEVLVTSQLINPGGRLVTEATSGHVIGLRHEHTRPD